MATKEKSGATVGFEAELWKAADQLRGSMDASEYKHVALALCPSPRENRFCFYEKPVNYD